MKDNGGPAFPQVRIWNPERREYEDAMYSSGMTLRDWFAGQAMQGLCAQAFKYMADHKGDEVLTESAIKMLREVSATSYYIADAMLKERT